MRLTNGRQLCSPAEVSYWDDTAPSVAKEIRVTAGVRDEVKIETTVKSVRQRMKHHFLSFNRRQKTGGIIIKDVDLKIGPLAHVLLTTHKTKLRTAEKAPSAT